jgi:hypothetical protein
VTLLIEDTARNNLARWTIDAIERGVAIGAILSPFVTGVRGSSYKQGAQQTVERIHDAGGQVWLDATTHALQMPSVGDFRYYDQWDFWGGEAGDLSSRPMLSDHVARVFEVQSGLGVSHLAPTLLLHHPESTTSERALELAQIAMELDPTAYISIAGDSAFWAAGEALDAHVGALAQLEPPGWFVTIARAIPVLPASVYADEVFGLCRTARSLSEESTFHVSHGDLAGLPAVAAGATSVGTGWDPRQRVCSYANYMEREETNGGGAWLTRVTFEGLLSVLVRQEAELLMSQDNGRATRLLPGGLPPAGPEEAFLWHATTLSRVVRELVALDNEAAFRSLLVRYEEAQDEWPIVAALTHTASAGDAWIRPVREGLELYGREESF